MPASWKGVKGTRRRRRTRKWRAGRKIGLTILILALIVAVKAIENRRDVVALEPLEDVLAVMASAPPGSFSIADPYAVEGEWVKVQLHTHTERSLDSSWPIAESLEAYARAGYTFVALADHDRITRPAGAPPDGLILIPAHENTVNFPFWPLGQHAVILFSERPIPRGSAAERFAEAQAQGAIVSISHPNWVGNLGSGRWEVRHLMAAPGFTLMEVYNPHSDSRLDTRTWHEVVVRRGPGQPVWAVAVDDAHDLELFDLGWTMVKVEERSLPALKAALLRGSLYPTTGPIVQFGSVDGAIVVEAGEDDATSVTGGETGAAYEVTFIDATGAVVARHQGPLPARYVPQGTERFVRVEVRSLQTGKTAWSQPFWLIPAQGEELGSQGEGLAL